MKKTSTIWEKTYYNPTYFNNAYHYQSNKETGNWSGVILIYKFLIKQYINKPYLLIKPGVVEFGGKNKEGMLADLEKKIEGMEEWSELEDRNYKEADVFPKEVEEKLKELNISYKRK